MFEQKVKPLFDKLLLKLAVALDYFDDGDNATAKQKIEEAHELTNSLFHTASEVFQTLQTNYDDLANKWNNQRCLYSYDGEYMEYCANGPCPHEKATVSEDELKRIRAQKIETEIINIVKSHCNRQGIAKKCPERIAHGLYYAHFRKADEVIDEFADNLKAKIENYTYENTEGADYCCLLTEELIDMINQSADEMKKEALNAESV